MIAIPFHSVRISDLAAYEEALDHVEHNPEPDATDEDIVLRKDDRGVYWLDGGYRMFIRTQLGKTTQIFAACTGDQSVRYSVTEATHAPRKAHPIRRHDPRGVRRPDGRGDRRDRRAFDGRRNAAPRKRSKQPPRGSGGGAPESRAVAYTSFLCDSAKKDLKKLPEDIRRLAAVKMRQLAQNPFSHNGPIKGTPNAYKARVTRRYRIGFFIHRDEHVVEFVRVRHRKEVYDNFPKYRALSKESSYRGRDAGPAERELERLLRVVIAGTRFEHRVFAVGGYVRDELLGKEPADLDIAVEMPYGAQRVSAFIQHLFPDVVVAPLALDYPIWHISFPDDLEYEGESFAVAGSELDVTDTQTLVYLDDESTTEYGPIAEDVKRRDFTVNTLFKDLSSGEIIDPTGTGQRDLERGVLRAVPAVDSLRAFREQPRQMLRLVRFMVQYDWQPDPPIQAALAASVDALATLSEHGLKKEFHKLKQKGLLDRAMQLMAEYGMLAPLRKAWQKAKVDQ